MKSAPIRFAGYAALFDIADADRDTIRKGAFKRSITNRRAPIPLLWQHRPGEPIGTVEVLLEDDRGLRVIGRVDRPHCRAATMLKRSEVSGLSFGYRARRSQQTEAGRELLDIDLFEVSLVTHPLQNGSRVHLVA